MKICFLYLLPGFGIAFFFFFLESKSYMKEFNILKNICSLKEKNNSLHLKYCWVVFMVSSWKQCPVDKIRPSTAVIQSTVIVFSFILLPVITNIAVNVLPYERYLRNLQKGIGFLLPQIACNTELNAQPPKAVSEMDTPSIKNMNQSKMSTWI